MCLCECLNVCVTERWIFILSTYMSQKIMVVVWVRETSVLCTSHNLQQKHTKTKDIGFNRKCAINHVLRGHIPAA